MQKTIWPEAVPQSFELDCFTLLYSTLFFTSQLSFPILNFSFHFSTQLYSLSPTQIYSVLVFLSLNVSNTVWRDIFLHSRLFSFVQLWILAIKSLNSQVRQIPPAQSKGRSKRTTFIHLFIIQVVPKNRCIRNSSCPT